MNLNAIFLLAGAMALSIPAMAQDSADLDPQRPLLYVADRFEVPVRQTGCNTCSILHYGLASGTPVIDLQEEADGWSKIETRTGIVGWMPSRFLFEEPVAAEKLVATQQKLDAQLAENQFMRQQIADLEAQLTEMGLSITRVASEDPNQPERMRLMGDVTAIDNQNETLLVRNQELQQELDILVASNERLRDDAWRGWFFYGALAVVAGAILASLLPRMRPRKRYDGWS